MDFGGRCIVFRHKCNSKASGRVPDAFFIPQRNENEAGYMIGGLPPGHVPGFVSLFVF